MLFCKRNTFHLSMLACTQTYDCERVHAVVIAVLYCLCLVSIVTCGVHIPKQREIYPINTTPPPNIVPAGTFFKSFLKHTNDRQLFETRDEILAMPTHCVQFVSHTCYSEPATASNCGLTLHPHDNDVEREYVILLQLVRGRSRCSHIYIVMYL